MVKIETKHPVESQLDSEFSAICNHCRGGLQSQEVKNFLEIFFQFFFGKSTRYGKSLKILY